MNILGIETSCDETALSLLECDGGLTDPHFKILAEAVHSQIETHKPFGGVFPMVAKREHARNLVPLFQQTLTEVDMLMPASTPINHSNILQNVGMILTREPELLAQFLQFIPTINKPPIDAIAVTYGPGLEPALWVGINFAKALGAFWNIPVIPTNHMEGHIFSVLMTPGIHAKDVRFPLLSLLISGGHTELVLAKNWLEYEILGETRDDAVGEAFDKAARILGLPYPGGPEISTLADEARSANYPNVFSLPRPMLKSDNYDFSFSGLKTSVLYKVKTLGRLSDTQRASIAREFEDSVREVLLEKTRRALLEYDIRTLVIGGGVVANKHLRESFTTLMKEFPETSLLLPTQNLSTDNAVMIAVAAYLRNLTKQGVPNLHDAKAIVAHGRARLSKDNT